MIATLPMYDRPETAAVLDAFWSQVAARLPDAPARLDHAAPLEDTWVRPDLTLSQTCGLPFQMWVGNHARYVASPDMRLPGAAAGHYNSVVVTRADEMRSPQDLLRARPMINQRHSQSGYAALWLYAETLGIAMTDVTVSGGHRKSAQAVARGNADIAAIDAHSWRLISRFDPWASDLKVINRTPATPAPPFICGASQDPVPLRKALSAAIDTLSDADRDLIGAHGITTLPPSAYQTFAVPPDAQTRATT